MVSKVQNRIVSERRLERVLHNETRTALNASYKHDHQDYIDFNHRITALNMYTYRERRIIASILNIMKIMKGTLKTELVNTINESLHISIHQTRSPHVFNVKRDNPPNSPLHIGISNVNTYRKQFDIEDSLPIIKRKLE